MMSFLRARKSRSSIEVIAEGVENAALAFSLYLITTSSGSENSAQRMTSNSLKKELK